MLHTGQLVGPGTVFRFRFMAHANNSVSIASNWSETSRQPLQYYDSVGAIYYVIAILIMFACTILLMFCSFVRKTQDDNSIVSYMKDLDRLERLQLKQEKFRTNLQIHQKKVHRILGPDRAEVLDESYVSPSPSIGLHTEFSWEGPEGPEAREMESAEGLRRPSTASLGTIIICADDLQQETGSPGTPTPQQHRRLSAPDRRLSAPARRLSAPASHPPSRACTMASFSAPRRPSRVSIVNGVMYKHRVASHVSAAVPKLTVHVYESQAMNQPPRV